MGRGKQTEAEDGDSGEVQRARCAHEGDSMWIFPRWEIHCWRCVRFASRSQLPMLTNTLACLDGTLNLWKTNSNFVRPDLTAQGAHVKGMEIGSLVFSVDGNTVLTRGGDHTVKCRFHVE